jgi:hypothetical protein
VTAIPPHYADDDPGEDDDWLIDPSVLTERPGWMPEDAEALGEGRFMWWSGETAVHADFGGIYRMTRRGEDVECVCDPETGKTCQHHERNY